MALPKYDSTNPYEVQPQTFYTQLPEEDKLKYLYNLRNNIYGYDNTIGEEAYQSLLQDDDITRFQSQLLPLQEELADLVEQGAVYTGEGETGFDISNLSADKKMDFYNVYDQLTDKYNTYTARNDPDAFPMTEEAIAEEAGGLLEAITGTAKDIGRDYYNLGSTTLGFLLGMNPVIGPGDQLTTGGDMYNYLMDEGLYKTPPGEDPLFAEGSLMDTLGFNELYSASSVDPNNPYADQAGYARFIANTLPLVLTGGRGILGNVTSKLSPRLQAFAGQMFPFLTKRGTFFPPKTKGAGFASYLNPLNYSFTAPSTTRNVALTMGLSAPQFIGNAEAALPTDDMMLGLNQYDPVTGNQTPVIFDSYMVDKLDNLYNQQQSAEDPGPRNNYQGL